MTTSTRSPTASSRSRARSSATRPAPAASRSPTTAFYNTNDNDPKTTADNNRDDELVREAVNAAKDYVNFADYDNDGDGTVDALGIIYAGGGPHDGCATDNAPSGSGSGSDHLWPHKTDLATTASVDGKTVRSYIINSELT